MTWIFRLLQDFRARERAQRSGAANSVDSEPKRRARVKNSPTLENLDPKMVIQNFCLMRGGVHLHKIAATERIPSLIRLSCLSRLSRNFDGLTVALILSHGIWTNSVDNFFERRQNFRGRDFFLLFTYEIWKVLVSLAKKIAFWDVLFGFFFQNFLRKS
jgi:hypothetical protein